MTHPSLVLDQVVREVLSRTGRLSVDAMTLDNTADLFDSGMSSHASVNVMVGLEEILDIEFPDSMLRRSTFSSIEHITDALILLGVAETSAPLRVDGTVR